LVQPRLLYFFINYVQTGQSKNPINFISLRSIIFIFEPGLPSRRNWIQMWYKLAGGGCWEASLECVYSTAIEQIQPKEIT
jgi:hypothetical protein